MRLTTLAILALISTSAIADDLNPGFEETFPHLELQALGEDLEKLGSAGLIRPKHVPQLQRPLTQSLEALQSADSSKAIQRLQVFKNKVSAQTAPEIGGNLVSQATAIQEQITAIVNRAVSATTGSCDVPKKQDFQSLPVGPAEKLTTISKALAFASSQGLYAVEFVLAPKVFREGLIAIDRHTRFIAPAGRARIVGAISNNGPYSLELQDVTVTGLFAAGAGTSIHANNDCAVTTLSDVEIQFADGTGIRQQGGSFTADGLVVAVSNAPDSSTSADRHIGRGLHLSDGVSACIANATLDFNESGALLAEDPGTRVFVSRLVARNNQVNPVVVDELFNLETVVPGSGSIEVRDEALLLGEWVRVESAQFIGLLVDNQAQAHVRYSQIDRTQSIRRDSVELGGSNVLISNGTAELNAIQTRHAQHSGLGIFWNQGGFLSASGSTVSNNLFGVGLLVDTSVEAMCAIYCVQNNVYRDNRNNISIPSNVAPLPCPPPPIQGPPPPGGCSEQCSACPTVSFSPSWCAD